MKVAIFSAYPYCPHLETELEIAQRHLDAGDEVQVWACRGELEACEVNADHALDLCVKCLGRRRVGWRMLSPRVAIRPLLRLTAEDYAERDRLPRRFASQAELKRFQVGRFDIGYAVVSSIVSQLRDPDLDMERHADLIDRLLRASWMVYRSTQRWLEDTRPDRVYVFNGRFAAMRGALRACQEAGVECLVHERGRDLHHFALYRNTLPHDLQYVDAQIRDAWERAESDPDRERIAEAWYQRRAAGDGLNWKSYVADQDPHQLPADWHPDRHNVVVFPSSEDEFEAIGDSWRLPFYPTQVEGLQAIVRSLGTAPDGMRLYVRMHPNLAGVNNERTQALRALSGRAVTLIAATDSVSTYALMRAARQVLTFGSTTGIEAVYWGIPSILAGQCFYSRLGGTYNPNSHAELMDLLTRSLEPHDRRPAMMYGYYWATVGERFRYFEPEGVFSGRFRGRTIRLSPWARLEVQWARVRMRWERRPAA